MNYYRLYLVGILLFVSFALAGSTEGGIIALLILIAAAGVLRLRYQFTVTDDWVMTRVGLIANNTNEMQTRHIRGINVRQGIVGRLLGIGTIEMLSAAEEGSKVIFHGIRNPHGLKERIKRPRE